MKTGQKGGVVIDKRSIFRNAIADAVHAIHKYAVISLFSEIKIIDNAPMICVTVNDPKIGYLWDHQHESRPGKLVDVELPYHKKIFEPGPPVEIVEDFVKERIDITRPFGLHSGDIKILHLKMNPYLSDYLNYWESRFTCPCPPPEMGNSEIIKECYNFRSGTYFHDVEISGSKMFSVGEEVLTGWNGEWRYSPTARKFLVGTYRRHSGIGGYAVLTYKLDKNGNVTKKISRPSKIAKKCLFLSPEEAAPGA